MCNGDVAILGLGGTDLMASSGLGCVPAESLEADPEPVEYETKELSEDLCSAFGVVKVDGASGRGGFATWIVGELVSGVLSPWAAKSLANALLERL